MYFYQTYIFFFFSNIMMIFYNILNNILVVEWFKHTITHSSACSALRSRRFFYQHGSQHEPVGCITSLPQALNLSDILNIRMQRSYWKSSKSPQHSHEMRLNESALIESHRPWRKLHPGIESTWSACQLCRHVKVHMSHIHHCRFAINYMGCSWNPDHGDSIMLPRTGGSPWHPIKDCASKINTAWLMIPFVCCILKVWG